MNEVLDLADLQLRDSSHTVGRICKNILDKEKGRVSYVYALLAKEASCFAMFLFFPAAEIFETFFFCFTTQGNRKSFLIDERCGI